MDGFEVSEPEFEVCQVGSVMEPQNACGHFLLQKGKCRRSCLGRARWRFMDAVKVGMRSDGVRDEDAEGLDGGW